VTLVEPGLFRSTKTWLGVFDAGPVNQEYASQMPLMLGVFAAAVAAPEAVNKAPRALAQMATVARHLVLVVTVPPSPFSGSERYCNGQVVGG
jgi:hypothetical protein